MLSDKINSLPISQTVGMTAKAHDLKNKGIDVITLSAGEPDFNIPDYIKDAAIDAIREAELSALLVTTTGTLPPTINPAAHAPIK